MRKLREEARAAGTELESNGKGGLPPSLVLHAMRRDGYRCTLCGGREAIGVHHLGGVPDSPWAARMGHSNSPANIATICHACHDDEHQGARAEGVDSSQVLPVGDLGTRRDKGQPKVAGTDGRIKPR